MGKNCTMNRLISDDERRILVQLIQFENLVTTTPQTAHTSGLAQIYGFLTGNYQAISVGFRERKLRFRDVC